ncbi:MAG: hypothetical protein WKF43_10585 [Acidimicrobiales bacterium]
MSESSPTADPPTARWAAVRVSVGGTPWFWMALVVGWALIAVGVTSARGERLAHFPDLVRFLLGFAIIHDAVLLPASVVLGWLTLRCVPTSVRAPVRVGLAVTWALALLSYPAVRRFGERPDNPSLLPTNVGQGLLVVLTVVWVAVIGEVVRRVVVARSRPA